ncbi:MFS transporter [Terriglobus sp. RCC_193]|uniref:MFS transporter n=1 Tax=Terriglobus sp. RCC_193 TaxID=3239218 RepID=UPI0035267940
MDKQNSRMSARQWQLVVWLFLIALVNYFDRQSLSVVAPRMQALLHLNDQGYAHIVSLFLFASAIAYGISGFISDRLGTRRSMALFVGWWSLAEAATAFVSTAWLLGLTRFCLGLGEPGLWVAAPKAVGETFDEKRRPLVISIYTMGATVGAIVALPIITAVTTHLPWRSIFLLDGVAGLLLVPVWFWIYRSSDSAASQQPAKANTMAVLRRSATWKLLVARSITDPVWYFLLFWFPKYLLSARHLPLDSVAKVGWIVYAGGGLGTLMGGLISGYMIRSGLRPGLAYRRIMLVAACIVPLSPLAAFIPGTLSSIFVAALIAFAHMGWLATLTAVLVDLYSQQQLGKAAGLIAMGSGFGGMLSSEAVGYLVMHGGYTPVFCLMAVLHPIAITLLWPVYTSREEGHPPQQLEVATEVPS